MVSAYSSAATSSCRKGKDVGGIFTNLPACRAPSRPAASSRTARSPRTPPPNALFGRTADAAQPNPG